MAREDKKPSAPGAEQGAEGQQPTATQAGAPDAVTDTAAPAADGKDGKADAGTEKSAKRSLQNVSKSKGFKAYITTEKHTIPIDILVRGETVNGHWSAKDGYVEFSVPDRLVEGFEMHYHFTSGNIVRAE